MLEAGDFWVMASDIEKGLDQRKQEQYKKWWELPSEKHNIAVGIFWRKKTKTQTPNKCQNQTKNPKTTQPFGEVEVMETEVTFTH